MGFAVDRGDLGVDLFANGEVVGPLLAAVAGKLGLADETVCALGQRYVDTVVANRGDRAGDDVALLQRGDGRLEGIQRELLDAEADALFPQVDVEHLDFDSLAFLVVGDRLFARAAPVQIRQVRHAVDVARKTDEQAELGGVFDIALKFGPDRVLFGEHRPRVFKALLDAEADPAPLDVDIEDRDLDLLTGRDDLAGVHVLLGPAHLRDMDQALDPGLELEEGAVIGNVGHPPLKSGPDRVFCLDALPRIGLELLHAEGDALGLGVEADDLHLDRLADL